jgi:hypothetical protein
VPIEQLQRSIPYAEYEKMPGLSYSAMKDLAVSPYRYWYWHLNPNRPERKESAEMRFGTALHCAVLEPNEFDRRYCREVDEDDFPDCLVTCEDLRDFLKSKAVKFTARTKAELIGLVQAVDPNAPILDVLRERDEQENAGKVRLSREDWYRARQCADSLRSEPKLRAILQDGQSEVVLQAIDPETKVPLKARLDWVTPTVTLDLKTFSQKHGKSIDKSVANAIFYEQYYLQAYFYSHLRALVSGNAKISGAQTAPEYIMAFVESEEPHEVRIRSLLPKSAGQVNVYWQTARFECRELLRTWADCMDRFGGSKPWRDPRSIDPLADTEIPQLGW